VKVYRSVVKITRKETRMGYYLQTPGQHHGKAKALVLKYGGDFIAGPPKSLAEVPEDYALVCVVNNGPFEAAGLAYSDEELHEFAAESTLYPDNPRPMEWILLKNKEQVHKDAGYL
jgi:hypothetical protein